MMIINIQPINADEKKNTFIITQQLSFSAHFVVLFSKV